MANTSKKAFVTMGIFVVLFIQTSIANAEKPTKQSWLPWTLLLEWPDNKWHTMSLCEVTELAKTFDGAKQHMQNSSGYWYPVSMSEDADKITFVYRDGLLKPTGVPMKSQRIFYRDMTTCKNHAKTLPKLEKQ